MNNTTSNNTNTIEEISFEFDAAESKQSASSAVPEHDAPMMDDWESTTRPPVRSSDDILETYQVSQSDHSHKPIQSSALDDIEAELMRLRQAVESIDNPEEPELPEMDFSDDMTDFVDNEPAIAESAEEPIFTEPEEEFTEPDAYKALADELLKAAQDREIYGVNSQTYRPEDYDVASQMAAIAPVQIDESELETIDASDIEALMMSMAEDDSQAKPFSNSFLADAAMADDEPAIQEDTEDFSLDLDVTEETITEETVFSLDTHEPELGQTTTSSGLDLHDDGEDTLEWLAKIRNEMSEKFDIDLAEPAPFTSAEEIEAEIDLTENTIDVPATPVAEEPVIESAPQFEDEIEQLNQKIDNLDLGSFDDLVDVQNEPSVEIAPTAAAEEVFEDVVDLSEPTNTQPENTLDNIDLNVFDTQPENTSIAPQTDDFSFDDMIELEINEPSTSAPQTSESNLDLSEEILADIMQLDVSDTPIAPLPKEATEEVAIGSINDMEVFDDNLLTLFDDEVAAKAEQAKLAESHDIPLDELDNIELADLNEFVNDHHAQNDQPSWLADAEVISGDSFNEANAIGIDDVMLSDAPQPTTSEEESLLEKITHTVTEWEENAEEWVEGMSGAIKEKAEELEMRAEILAHEVGEWVEGMTHAVEDKTEELEMRAEILVHEAVDSVKESLEIDEPKLTLLDEEEIALDDLDLSDITEATQPENTDIAVDTFADLNLSDIAEATQPENTDITVDTFADLDLSDITETTQPENTDITLDTFADLDLSDITEATQPENTDIAVDTFADLDLSDITETTQPENTDMAQDASEELDTSAQITPTDSTDKPIDVAATDAAAFAAATAAAVAVATSNAQNAENAEEEKLGWAARLKQGLSKSRNQMAKSLAGVFGGGKIDEDLYEELETTLLISDMGIEATEQLMKEVRNRVSLKGLSDGAELRQALKDAIYDLLKPLEQPLVIPDNGQPFVIMMAGINGAGKTTSIGKLAKYFQAQGKSVMLAAGDTFRAAAREQLQEWGARNGVTVISQASGDSAAVCFDAVESAKAKKIDIVLADTAGRLPTQLHLMEEIKKVKRVLQKAMPDAPHEIIVVLDANIGQNAINQVVAFDDALGVTGLIVTKLDGTAKGGVLAALASNRPIPVRYIGVGESIDDLRPFDARAFVDALLDE